MIASASKIFKLNFNYFDTIMLIFAQEFLGISKFIQFSNWISEKFHIKNYKIISIIIKR